LIWETFSEALDDLGSQISLVSSAIGNQNSFIVVYINLING